MKSCLSSGSFENSSAASTARNTDLLCDFPLSFCSIARTPFFAE
uniref:Uncharacterized protein n=1 Tax=Caudovirales sp. ctNZz8 TaxID=2826772 RepID=A0A8S5QYC7_9CAUD|nr:MAG TPA: hypothetical protein [Caudovirales sp. ctNZz8]